MDLSLTYIKRLDVSVPIDTEVRMNRFFPNSSVVVQVSLCSEVQLILLIVFFCFVLSFVYNHSYLFNLGCTDRRHPLSCYLGIFSLYLSGILGREGKDQCMCFLNLRS